LRGTANFSEVPTMSSQAESLRERILDLMAD
jgi:hypothetical protein